MLLSEYTLIPDVFDINSYGNENSDDNCRRELCGVYLKEVIKVLSEEAIARDLCNGELINFIRKMPTKHPITKHFLKSLAERLRKFPASSQLPPNAEKWCQEAINSHNVELLTGIITTKQTKSIFNDEIIIGAIENLEKTSWWQNRSSSIRLSRTTNDYIQHLQPILNHSKSLMFIDPYLNPSSQGNYKEFIHLLKAIPNRNKSLKIEIHVSLGGNITKETYYKNLMRLRESLQQHLPNIECFIWDDFHDRYLISDLIGVSLPHGFGIGKSRTTWTRIGRKDKDEIQREFDRPTKVYKLIKSFKL